MEIGENFLEYLKHSEANVLVLGFDTLEKVANEAQNEARSRRLFIFIEVLRLSLFK